MRAELLRWCEQIRVPRYTSYPTAPHFHPGICEADYRRWLAELAPGLGLSVYLHVPFCRELCWYCGCHTAITHRPERVAAYVELLLAEIRRVLEQLPEGMELLHLHWGGGTPSIIGADALARVTALLRERLRFAPEAECAIELDPRRVDERLVEALARIGINRASLGVQTLDPEVQRAIGRIQPWEVVEACARRLRAAGIHRLAVDLLYGLPRQSCSSVVATARQVLELRPDRVAVFAYAHLPHIKRHQRLIDPAAIPKARERAEQFEALCQLFTEAGYVPVGLDHFARPEDAMARALREGRLRRNFQGYTTDPAEVLLGFGASAIGSLPQGYVQNHPDLRAYRRVVLEGGLPVARGYALGPEDRAIREVIERVMCYGRVDLAEVARRHGLDVARLEPDGERFGQLLALGVASREGSTVALSPGHRPLVRLLAAAFDRFLEPEPARHALAL